MDLNFFGIIVGASTFLIIGVSHPLVIYGEYYFGRKIWWAFFAVGLIFSALSLVPGNPIVSTILGACAFSLFWGVKEVFDQEKRILKGWFPENPKRSDYYAAKRKEYNEKNNK